jgi:hypothetical protein
VADIELSELKRALEVGFAELRGHVDTRFAQLNGRLDVMSERQDAMGATQKRHSKELEDSAKRRWPLPVLGVLGAVGGMAAAAWTAMPHK